MPISNVDSIVVLRVLTAMQKQLDALTTDIASVKTALARIEEIGLNVNIYERGDDDSEDSDESSDGDSTQSAPF